LTCATATWQEVHVLVLTSTALVWFQALLADLSSKVCQGPDSPKGSTRFLRITLFSLNQARRLGSLLRPHRAFQGHAAHMARWPVMLSPNGSSDTCMSEMLALIPPCRFTAQRAHRVPVYPRSCDIPPYCFHGATAHLRRILLMEQQVWSRQRARRSTVRPRVAADNHPCDLVSQCFPLMVPFRTRFLPCEMARIAYVQRLIGCLYTLWYCYIPICRFHGTGTPDTRARGH
jgi:hypothetical protein